MEGSTKIVVGVVLIVVIVGAIVALLWRSDVLRGPQPPEWVKKQPIERIDAKTNEVITKTLGEWEDLGQKDGMYKNPNTKTYSMVSPMPCAACGKKIPAPQMPASPPPAAGQPPAPLDDAKIMEFQKNAKCPLCGKNPYPPEMLTGGPGMPPRAPAPPPSK